MCYLGRWGIDPAFDWNDYDPLADNSLEMQEAIVKDLSRLFKEA
jgi:hypothetical protein